MSVKIMGECWDLELPYNELLVLLAFADHADHTGGAVRPSVELIAWKTGYQERQVRRIVDKLRKRKIMILVKASPGRRPNEYRIDTRAGTLKAPFRETLTHGSVTSEAPPNPVNMTVSKRQGLPGQFDRVDAPTLTFATLNPDIAMSGDPSWNHDHGDQRESAERAPRARSRSSPPEQEETEHAAITAYRTISGLSPNKASALAIVADVDESSESIARWSAQVSAWITTGNKPTNVKGMLDWYKRGGPSYDNGHGRHAPENRSSGSPPAPNTSAKLQRLRERSSGRARAVSGDPFED